MLPKKFRATKKEIENTLKNGKIISAGFIYAKVSYRDLKNPTFAIIVPKKTEKTSVGRHLLKRRVGAVLESIIPSIENFNRTIIFFVQKSTTKPDFSEIKKSVLEILKKSGAIV